MDEALSTFLDNKTEPGVMLADNFAERFLMHIGTSPSQEAKAMVITTLKLRGLLSADGKRAFIRPKASALPTHPVYGTP